MSEPFFDKPVLNSPYAYPGRHWELDAQGQPTQKILEARRKAEFVTPIPKPKKRSGQGEQASLIFDHDTGLSSPSQQYEKTASMINAVRQEVDRWRAIPDPGHWRVTPETARLLQHWRRHEFSSIRPFFCQVEAVETLTWLDTYWVPGVNHLKTHGRWAFAEFTDVWQMQVDFAPQGRSRVRTDAPARRPEQRADRCVHGHGRTASVKILVFPDHEAPAMTKNITFTAEENLIKRAREAARAQGTTLNEQFRLWLEQYARQRQVERGMEVVDRISQYASSGGRKFSRDEMNERR